MEETSAVSVPGRSPLMKIALGVAAIVALVWLTREGGAYMPAFVHWVNDLGVWGPIVFIAGYVVATLAVLPVFVLTLAGGAIFGLGFGVLYVFIAAVLGSAAAFLVARYVARGMIERLMGGNARLAAIDRAVGQQGRKIVFLVRLSPAFPFTLLNYGFGLTQVSFADYLAASIGMLPGTLLYVYYGKVVGDVAALAGGATVQKGMGYYAVLTLGLVATVLVTALVTRSARNALRDVAEA